MPVEWVLKQEGAPGNTGAFLYKRGAPPAFRLHLWPYRSLPKRGFAGFIGGTAALALLPLLMLLGSPVLWGILPFLTLALGALWYSIQRSYRDGELLEELNLWADRIEVIRYSPRDGRQEWAAEPHWVSVHLHSVAGPVPHYLTLRGAGREVELGAFLTANERLELHQDLQRALARA